MLTTQDYYHYYRYYRTHSRLSRNWTPILWRECSPKPWLVTRLQRTQTIPEVISPEVDIRRLRWPQICAGLPNDNCLDIVLDTEGSPQFCRNEVDRALTAISQAMCLQVFNTKIFIELVEISAIADNGLKKITDNCLEVKRIDFGLWIPLY